MTTASSFQDDVGHSLQQYFNGESNTSDIVEQQSKRQQWQQTIRHEYSIVKGFSQFSVSIIRTLDVWHEMDNFSGKILESTPKYIICLCFSKWFILYTRVFVRVQILTHLCFYETDAYFSCSLLGWSNNAKRRKSCFVFINYL